GRARPGQVDRPRADVRNRQHRGGNAGADGGRVGRGRVAGLVGGHDAVVVERRRGQAAVGKRGGVPVDLGDLLEIDAVLRAIDLVAGGGAGGGEVVGPGQLNLRAALQRRAREVRGGRGGGGRRREQPEHGERAVGAGVDVAVA